ncbi:MAG: polyprenyl synthetase family protein [Pseudomonadota bacterium]
MTDFKKLLNSHANLVESTLEGLLSHEIGNSDDELEIEVARPGRLVHAMRHSSLDGGKRLRPFLVMESAALFGVSPEESVFAASALECIHCYSLVHDDLPAMDNDDLRRGKPTTHKAFDEATAILAGDALLTLAFDVLSRKQTHPDASVRSELVQLYARNAGLGGMVGGQMLDLEAESKTPDAMEITILQSMKTGALLRCACVTGAVLGGAEQAQRMGLLQFGNQIGNAFQLADDILDVTSDAETMGKRTGKDADKGKGTLVGLYGLEKCRQLLDVYLEGAMEGLEDFGPEADILRETAQFIVDRKN